MEKEIQKIKITLQAFQNLYFELESEKLDLQENMSNPTSILSIAAEKEEVMRQIVSLEKVVKRSAEPLNNDFNSLKNNLIGEAVMDIARKQFNKLDTSEASRELASLQAALKEASEVELQDEDVKSPSANADSSIGGDDSGD